MPKDEKSWIWPVFPILALQPTIDAVPGYKLTFNMLPFMSIISKVKSIAAPSNRTIGGDNETPFISTFASDKLKTLLAVNELDCT